MSTFLNMHAGRWFLPLTVAALLVSSCGTSAAPNASSTTISNNTISNSTISNTSPISVTGGAAPAGGASAGGASPGGASPGGEPTDPSVPTTPPPTVPDTAPATLPDPPTSHGFMIKDTTTSQSGLISHYDAVSCDSEKGPWHIVVSFTVPDNLTNNVFYDATVGADGTGTMTGQEHSTWTTGLKIDGTYSGTAKLSPGSGDAAFLLGLDFAVSLNVIEPADIRGPRVETSHLTKSLKVLAATAAECP